MYLLSLPVELLVYIISFLPTVRDKVKLRYVSRRLQVVSETPSLWSEFVWPLYDRREEHSVLRDCGEYIKRLVFPDHVITSTLVKMLSYCNNVTELRLPPGSKLSCKQLEILQSMEQLEKLEVLLSSDFKPLLQIGRLKELTVHAEEKETQLFCMPCVEEWVAKGFISYNLNIVVHTYNLNIVEHEFVEQLQKSFLESWRQWNSTIPVGHTAYLKLYNTGNNRSPLNFFPIFPTVQLEFSQTATLPFVKTSSFGVLGLEGDLVLLTDTVHDGRTAVKAKIMTPDEFNHILIILNSSVKSLNFVTDFDFIQCQFLHSGHLEQLAIACPNIQRLNLGGNTECLDSLQGLRMIAHCCVDLCGLNLRGIALENVVGYTK